MIFDARALELFLRILLARAGGSATFRMDTEMEMSDDLVLFAEATEEGDGITLSAIRIDDEHAGHC